MVLSGGVRDRRFIALKMEAVRTSEMSVYLYCYETTHSEGTGFKSRQGDRLSRLRFLVVFLGPSRKMQG
jgi:hypothetical protein